MEGILATATESKRIEMHLEKTVDASQTIEFQVFLA
jgi:hypothetical protein